MEVEHGRIKSIQEMKREVGIHIAYARRLSFLILFLVLFMFQIRGRIFLRIEELIRAQDENQF